MDGTPRHVVMVAAENGSLRGGKVGGVADVIRDLPRALAALGWRITVITPSYGFLHTDNRSVREESIAFPFRGDQHEAEVWRVRVQEGAPAGIGHILLEHPDMRGEPIYYNDRPETPFLRDATKYALFCSAAGRYLQTLKEPYILHLHDWHAATILLLAELHPEFARLREVRTAYTIHNLSIQGTRPMEGNDSSVAAWFPELFRTRGWISIWRDARYAVPCYTPMAVGIRFSDKVNTVSPTYAREILKPSDPKIGAFRGEGLEELLQNAATGKRLCGILNGCEYPDSPPDQQSARLPFGELSGNILHHIRERRGMDEPAVAGLEQRLERLAALEPRVLLTGITRVVEQKVRLFFERGSDGQMVLDHLHRLLEERNGVFLLLGSGTTDYEERFAEFSRTHARIVFIRGYYDEISQLLYRNGNLFLMPSIFEPCGISQMVAMREGQPCLVHFTGGLCDTVIDMESGFGFSGRSFTEIADNFVGVLGKALDIYFGNPSLWAKIERGARGARFTWEQSARQYVTCLYNGALESPS